MSKQIEKPGFLARQAAVECLNSVFISHLPISNQLDCFRVLEGSERARAQRLALKTLRELTRVDYVLGLYLNKMPAIIPLNILRLAVIELCAEKSAPHAVVDTAVTLMKKTKKFSQFASLTNAVLRKISSHNVESWSEYEVTKLPKWLRKRLVHIYDEQAVTEIEKAHMSGAQTDITLKPELDINQWALDLNATVLPTGSLRLIGGPKITSLKGYDEGCWWVQDAAAALAVKILSPKNGELILDVCAAPGGKTLQLISFGAEVVSIDKSVERLRRLKENLTRTKQSCEVINSDFLTWKSSQKFDAILIDAPCSATGTIRRHPDLSIIKNGTGLDELYALQASFIDKAVSLLKPNGRLVFATCSLLAEEGELQFKSALQRHNLSVLRIDYTRLGVMKEWISSKTGGIRLRPDYWKEFGGMDGFFIGLARKTDGLVNVSKAE